MKYDVSGIGNPLLDLTLKIEEDFLLSLGFKKGSMMLLDEDAAKKIVYKIRFRDIKTSPGGSVANVLAGVSLLGGKTMLFGKIGEDDYGERYLNDTKKVGTETGLVGDKEERTGFAITFITPDKERTFAVYLGAALHFKKEDVNANVISDSQVLHLEGFKVEDCKTGDTLQYAIKVAKKNKTKVSLDLSDGELVKRNLSYLKDFVRTNVDIVFANETEAEAFTGKKDKEALYEISKMCELAVVKLGEKGSLIKKDDFLYDIKPRKTKVKNTNGAGDMYAAGILYGITNDVPLQKAGEMASRLASLVVATDVARLEGDLKSLYLDDGFVNFK